METFPEFKGVVVYGSFPVSGSRPNDVDLMLVLESDPNSKGNAKDRYLGRMNRLKDFFRNSDPNYHVYNGLFYMSDPETIVNGFEYWHVREYIFIGDREAKKVISTAVSGLAEEVRI